MKFTWKVIGVVMLVVALFIPGIKGGFLLDDGINIIANYVLYIEQLSFDNLIYAALSFHDGNGSRALPMMTFAIDYWRAGGMEASTFKTTNIIIHGITTFFLAFFFYRLLILAKWNEQTSASVALILTLVWALHPLQVSSVLYVVQRMQTLATLFLVLALWAYLCMRQIQLQGGRGRQYGIVAILMWLMALTCKEDAVLFPVFTLCLELTILKFDAVQDVVRRGLRQSYGLFIFLTIIIYFFVILPKFGCWDICPGRNFNSLERLLTQARVLVMYIGQTLFPFSDNLPFVYENYPVSRNLFRPWTTITSLLIIFSLIIIAWHVRRIRPLFSLGIFLFFAGHFIASNVILLELVFEHRNQFPLIGLILAVSDLILFLIEKLKFNDRSQAIFVSVIIIYISGNLINQIYIWSDATRLGKKLTELSPLSVRAWNQYAAVYFDKYIDTQEPESLSQAILITEQAFKNINSPSLAANLIIYKSLYKTVKQDDWNKYFDTLKITNDSRLNRNTVNILRDNYIKGILDDNINLIKALDVLYEKNMIERDEYFITANKVFNSKKRDQAIIFFKRYVEISPFSDVTVLNLIRGLSNGNYKIWANQLKDIERMKLQSIH
ncbi:hypothetical protein ABEF86_13715 [Acinetobacter thermotolerans]|uniref:hypothetical protein n=1 Tax=Acinetobacter thermotolerans TaxID=3151487 RepID=UPI00325AA555